MINIMGYALRGLFFCIYASGNEVMIKVWYKEKWIITKSSHYPFYNFLLKVITSTINYYLSPVIY